jgi:CubicO group peptidase (beta-lactamase class C family)
VFRYLFQLVIIIFLISSATCAEAERHFPSGTNQVLIPKTDGVRTEMLERIAPLIQASIAAGHYPGAVVLVGHRGRVIYRGVFGNRRILPDVAPMRFDTLFDAASLTKVMATTPAIMQLVEQNRIQLDTPVAQYWPAFANNNKESITVRELLTHTSGLPAEITPHSRADAIVKIERLKPAHKPGTKFLYSDVNFIALGHLIEEITDEELDHYAHDHIFQPLGMRHTLFLPDVNSRDNIAPSELLKDGLRWGEVHDPVTYVMDGVSGAAGLFTTASDLGTYAQSILDGGRIRNQDEYFLSPLTVLKMTTPQTPSEISEVRGFGWDIDSRFSNRGILLPTRSFGHSGWTGTSVWIDPATQTWIVILTSRAHPTPLPNNPLIKDRCAIANFVAASLTDIKTVAEWNTSRAELARAYSHA